MNAPTPVLVVAGGTATGKSTLCGWLAERGAAWIEADLVGHAMLAEETVLATLVERFGDSILDEAGRISRPAPTACARWNRGRSGISTGPVRVSRRSLRRTSP